MPDSYTEPKHSISAPTVERKPVMGLVKFPCGCVGWPTINEEARVLVIDHCDYDARDGRVLSLGYRSVNGSAKPVPISFAEERRLLDEIRRLFAGGYALDAVRSTF